MSDGEDVSALSPDAHEAVGVVNGRYHDAVVSQQGEEKVLLALGASRTDVDAVVPAACSRSSNIDVEAIAIHK